MAVIAIMLPFTNFDVEIIYYEFLIVLSLHPHRLGSVARGARRPVLGRARADMVRL